MKRFFDEEVKTESKYNRVPEGMRTRQFVECAGCDYRIYYMQVDIAIEEARLKGGSKRDYLSGFLMQPIPECMRREKCLVGGFLIRRGAKAPSSPTRRLINPENLNKPSKEGAKKE